MTPDLADHPIPPDPRWPRYQPATPFPPYRYVPGRSPHPRRHPHGHLFGKPEPHVPPFEPDDWATNAVYLHGVDLYNFAYWWECHEVLEGLWNTAGRASEPGQFLQAIIQAAAGHLKAFVGHEAGSRRLWGEARRRLAPARDRYMGVDVRAFERALKRHAADPGGEFPLLRLDVAS